jgi:hypothetical protein
VSPDNELQAIRAQLRLLGEETDLNEIADHAERLAGHVYRLDQSLSGGGDLPGPWAGTWPAPMKRHSDAEHLDVTSGPGGGEFAVWVTHDGDTLTVARWSNEADAELMARLLSQVPLTAVAAGLDIDSFADNVATLIRTQHTLTRLRSQQ